MVEDKDSKAGALVSSELDGEQSQDPEVAGGVEGAEEEGGAGEIGGVDCAGGMECVGGAECVGGGDCVGGADCAGGADCVEGVEWHAARTHCTWPLPRAAHAHYVLDDDVHVCY